MIHFKKRIMKNNQIEDEVSISSFLGRKMNLFLHAGDMGSKIEDKIVTKNVSFFDRYH